MPLCTVPTYFWPLTTSTLGMPAPPHLCLLLHNTQRCHSWSEITLPIARSTLNFKWKFKQKACGIFQNNNFMFLLLIILC